MISYYCPVCNEEAESWRDSVHHLEPGICLKHKVHFIKYTIEEIINDLEKLNERQQTK